MAKPITVSQLNNYIDSVIRKKPELFDIVVKGEVTGTWFAANNAYGGFNLKDENCVVKCFLGDVRPEFLNILNNSEKEVIVTGSVTVYKRDGRFQIQVKNIEQGGEADLAKAFEELKAKLAKEGLFDEEHKKPLPPFPRNIAVVTSDSGAAVRDIIDTVTARNSVVNLYICDVLVQGDKAPYDIASMIDDINENLDFIDIIIVGRGGGSREDLQAFNEEIVARSIYNSKIPVISAVGHETDTSISDYVADAYAITPTRAATYIVDTNELREDILDIRKGMSRDMDGIFSEKALRARNSYNALLEHEPIKEQQKRIDELKADIDKSLAALVPEARNMISEIKNNMVINNSPKIIVFNVQ